MGLLKLFLQNQSGLDINPTPAPGNGPIEPATGEFNTGANSFVQVWNSNKTYLSTFVGGTNTGIQPPTLAQTGLDVDNPTAVPSTTIPNTLTAYPATALGGLGQSAVQFLQIWSPVINYNSVVAGAPTSPLEQSLNETGLDNTDSNFVPTTTTPSTVTQYPSISTGEFGGGSTQYSQIYNSNNTYLNNVPVEDPNSPQLNTLSQTGLDTENQNAAPTTVTPNTITQYPTLVSGEFSTGASQYIQNYGPNNTYLNSNFTNAQEGTLDLTGLDNTDTSLLPTTISPQQVPASPQILPPQTFMGEFGGAPSQFTPQYNPNVGQGYLNTLGTIISNAGNPQITALNETGLDIEDPSAAPTTYVVPGYDNVTSYPANATGEYNGPATPYGQTYTPEATYEDIIVNSVNGPTSVIENSTQFTGLDIENQDAAPTTYAVPQVDNITVYPPEVTGELGGAPSPYNQEWEPTNKYYNFMKENYQAQ
jgi:hypothetical protein